MYLQRLWFYYNSKKITEKKSLLSQTVNIIKKVYRIKKMCNLIFYQTCSIKFSVSLTHTFFIIGSHFPKNTFGNVRCNLKLCHHLHLVLHPWNDQKPLSKNLDLDMHSAHKLLASVCINSFHDTNSCQIICLKGQGMQLNSFQI